MKPGADPSEIPPFRRPRQPLSAFELWQLHKERRELRQSYFEHWNATNNVTGTGRPVDAIIAPVMPYTSLPHGSTGCIKIHVFFLRSGPADKRFLHRPATYTLVFSTLDCPSLVVPVTKVDPGIDVKVAPHRFSGDDDEALYNICKPSWNDIEPIC